MVTTSARSVGVPEEEAPIASGLLVCCLLMLFSLFSASYAQFVLGQARVVSVTPSPESPDDPAGCVRQRLVGQTEYWYIQQDQEVHGSARKGWNATESRFR